MKVIDGIIAAPENAIIRRESVVVELVPTIAQPLAVFPADGGHLAAVSGSVTST